METTGEGLQNTPHTNMSGPRYTPSCLLLTCFSVNCALLVITTRKGHCPYHLRHITRLNISDKIHGQYQRLLLSLSTIQSVDYLFLDLNLLVFDTKQSIIFKGWDATWNVFLWYTHYFLCFAQWISFALWILMHFDKFKSSDCQNHSGFSQSVELKWPLQTR